MHADLMHFDVVNCSLQLSEPFSKPKMTARLLERYLEIREKASQSLLENSRADVLVFYSKLVLRPVCMCYKLHG